MKPIEGAQRRLEREKAGVTLGQLAKQSGINICILSYLERDLRRWSPSNRRAFDDALIVCRKSPASKPGQLVRGEAEKEARGSLPKHLRPVFDHLVSSYQEACVTVLGRRWVCYRVLAELARMGWRCPDE